MQWQLVVKGRCLVFRTAAQPSLVADSENFKLSFKMCDGLHTEPGIYLRLTVISLDELQLRSCSDYRLSCSIWEGYIDHN